MAVQSHVVLDLPSTDVYGIGDGILLAVGHAGFQGGPGHPGGALRPEGDAPVPLVLEGVHLLLHHVRAVAHAAREQLCVLEHRRADLAVAGQRAYRAHGRLDFLPAVRVIGQHVLRSLGRLRKHSDFSFPMGGE